MVEIKRGRKSAPPPAALLGGRDHPFLKNLLKILAGLAGSPALVALVDTILGASNPQAMATEILSSLPK